MGQADWLDAAFQAVAIDDDGRACRDIPETACREEAGNFFLHTGALTLSKSADALVDPKLVLSWLMNALGAPSSLVGLLVPIREAGALLPQLVTAGALRRLPQRKWAWSVGALLQGLSAIAIAAAALTLSGAFAGWVILAALAVLALSRSVCSVCYKDVLGKTVSKSRRGTATGLAGSLAAVTAIVFALILSAGVFERYWIVISAIFLAGAAWIASALLFTQLTEEAGATEGGKSALKEAVANFNLLRRDKQLRRFILTRALLTATALAPPFMVAMGAGSGSAFAGLGLLVLASAGAGLVSSYVWGRLSDRSSRKVLVLSAVSGALALLATAGFGALGWLDNAFALPILLFVLMIAYQGVRLGRSTHLVDMASEDTRAAYTALSNTIIGLVLIAGAGLAVLETVIGAGGVIAALAGLCLLAVPAALGLEEVQRD